MKLIVSIFGFVPFLVFSQEFYVTPTVGYQYVLESDNEITSLVNDSVLFHYQWAKNQTDFDLNNGSVIGVGLGYQFSSKLSAAFNFSLWRAHNVIEKVNYFDFEVEKIKGGAIINFSPTLHYSFKDLVVDQWSPYTSVGVMLTTGYLSYQQTYSNISDTTTLIQTAQIDYEYAKGMTFGVAGEIGMEYQINNRLRFFGAIHGVLQQIMPREGYMTSYTVDGVDQLDNQLPSTSTIAYVSEDDPKLVQLSGTINDPEYRKIQTYTFNSIGFKFGIQYTFGVEKE